MGALEDGPKFHASHAVSEPGIMETHIQHRDVSQRRCGLRSICHRDSHAAAAGMDVGISFRYAPKRFAGASLQLTPTSIPGETKHRRRRTTFYNKVLIAKADTSCVNKSGHFHLLSTRQTAYWAWESFVGER